MGNVGPAMAARIEADKPKTVCKRRDLRIP